MRFYARLLSLLPPDMLLVYINLYWLWPAFLKKRQYFLYCLFVLLAMSAISALNIALHQLYAHEGATFYQPSGVFNVPNFATQLLNSSYLLALTSGLKFFRDWLDRQDRIKEKERQQIALELSFLKAQVHPHFFFNTLNNLYALTLQKSDLAPEVVLRLSSLMSYMLYESGADTVPLAKEIANLEDYIALEQLRFGDRLTLTFRKDGLTTDPIRIPPLLLLTFVENSFKHGIGQTIGDGHIDISLSHRQQLLFFSIDNSVGRAAPEAGPHIASPGGNTNGLGLKNVTRRLDLLYGADYRLDRVESAANYHITLKIPVT